MKSMPRTIAALFNEESLSIPIAKSMLRRFGWEMSVLIQHIHFNIYNHINFHMRVKEFSDKDGQIRYWVRNTYSKWRDELCLTSDMTVRRMINFLEKEGIILSREGKGRFKYYTIDYDKLEASIHVTDQNEQSTMSDQNEQSCLIKMNSLTDQNEQSLFYIEKENKKRLLKKEGEETASLSSPPHPQEDALSLPKISLSVKKEKIRGTRLPKDWDLTDEQRERSIRAGMMTKDLEGEIFGFKNYWLNCTSRDAVKIDWWLAWQGHVRRYCSFKGIEPDYTCFGSKAISDAAPIIPIPKYVPPEKHPRSDEFVRKIAEKFSEIEYVNKQTEGYIQKSQIKLVSVGDGKATLWVNKELDSYKFSLDCAKNLPESIPGCMRRIFLDVLREFDPTIEDIDAIEVIWEVARCP